MVSSFIQFAINSILLMTMLHFAVQAYDYARNKRYLAAVAKIKNHFKK